MAVHGESMNSSTTPSGSNTSSSDDSTVPSELFFRHAETISGGDSLDDCGDHAALLENVLSSLAAQTDLVTYWKVETNGELSDWMWNALTIPSVKNDDGLPASPTYLPESVEYEWWMGAQLMAILLPKLSSFEIHSIATQSSVFTDGSQSHWTLCLLVCAYSLRQCPQPLEQRWKRWQSLTCETVRLFQNYGVETGYHALTLWTNHIAPACQHVLRQLPSEALRVAILSGLVGTTSTLVMKECDRLEQVHQVVFLSRGKLLLNTVRAIVREGGEAEEWIWSNPWRSKETFPEEQDEEVALQNYKNNIAWWNQAAHRHETVAGMDTSWNPKGISMLAVMAFDDRPQTFTPNYTWNTWFPHVAILFKTSAEHHFLDSIPLLLLDNLIKFVPEKSLPTVSSAATTIDAPYETFQLLSNRMMVKPPKKSKLCKKQVELESKARSERIVGLMKSLLSRYPSINQIKIVRKLVHDCPHPGLQAKFMDLLRPVVFEEECAEALWSYIGSFIKDLEGHVAKHRDELFNINDLINKVELYVGAITMIQLWCMVKGKLPKKIKGSPLGKFYKILKRSIAAWMSDQNTMPPDEYYRLYLLEGALHQVVQTLDAARQKRKHFRGEDGSLSSSSTTLEGEDGTSGEGSQQGDEGVDDTAVAEKECAIVGDADIFS